MDNGNELGGSVVIAIGRKGVTTTVVEGGFKVSDRDHHLDCKYPWPEGFTASHGLCDSINISEKLITFSSYPGRYVLPSLLVAHAYTHDVTAGDEEKSHGLRGIIKGGRSSKEDIENYVQHIGEFAMRGWGGAIDKYFELIEKLPKVEEGLSRDYMAISLFAMVNDHYRSLTRLGISPEETEKKKEEHFTEIRAKLKVE